MLQVYTGGDVERGASCAASQLHTKRLTSQSRQGIIYNPRETWVGANAPSRGGSRFWIASNPMATNGVGRGPRLGTMAMMIEMYGVWLGGLIQNY